MPESRNVRVDPNVFETANAGFAQAMYEEFLRDPSAVGPEWRRLFESGVVGESNGAGKQVSGEAGKQTGGGGPAAAEPFAASPSQTRLLAYPPTRGTSPIKGPAAKL